MAQQRQLAAPAYLVALALVCIPPFDALMQVLPIRIHDPRWRFGAYGLLSNALMIPLTGLLIAFLATLLVEHFRVQKVLGLLALLVAAGTAALLVVFALDALQVRATVAPAAQAAFRVASITAVFKSLLGVLTLGTFGYAAFHTPKIARAVAKAPRGAGGGLIIAGKTAAQTVGGKAAAGALSDGGGASIGEVAE